MPGWGGGFAEALQHGDALPRSRSGEATCLLGSLASDFAFLQMSYCWLAPSHVVELHSEGFTLAVPSPSLPRYVWYFFWQPVLLLSLQPSLLNLSMASAWSHCWRTTLGLSSGAGVHPLSGPPGTCLGGTSPAESTKTLLA